MKRKGFLAILTAMAMIGSMGVCVYAADDAASTEDVLADYTGKADYKIGFSQCTLASPFYVTMKEVAEHCTQYCPCETGKCGCSNSTAESVSCTNCTHYTEPNVCDLDLYSEIMKNHDF